MSTKKSRKGGSKKRKIGDASGSADTKNSAWSYPIEAERVYRLRAKDSGKELSPVWTQFKAGVPRSRGEVRLLRLQTSSAQSKLPVGRITC